MPFFFGRRDGDQVEIEGDDARHLARSLRVRPGELVSVVEPAGRLLSVRVESVGPSVVRGRVESERDHRPEPERSITVACAMLPASSLDLVLSRCTEAGAARFTLIAAERSVARDGRPDRWASICREAAMLAGRLRVPPVTGPVPFRKAWDESERPYLLDSSGGPMLGLASGATLFVGPEGGWSPGELQHAGTSVLSLGPRNLRADTAALAGLVLALSLPGG